MHFGALDGLRGVAAIMVAIGHVSMMVGLSIVPSKLLAVHFFFMLSGFVAAYAYEARLAAGMRVSDYLSRRIIRLYPLIVAGALFGFLSRCPFGSLDIMNSLAAKTLMAAVVIPQANGTFPTNPPEWSLFFELVAYVAFATVLCRLSSKTLICTTIPVAAVGFFGMVKYKDHVPFLLHLFDATASFVLGILLTRWREAGGRIYRLPMPILAFAIVGVCLTPLNLGPAVDIAAILVLFPLIILSGASRADGPKMRRVDALLGDLSFPLYILHWPVALVATYWLSLVEIGGSGAIVISLCATTLIAYALLRLYDEPLRNWLVDRFVRRGVRSED